MYTDDKESLSKLEAFARGGYKSATQSVIRKEPTAFDKLWKMLKDDLQTLYQFKKLALGTVFVVGLLFGFILRGLFVSRRPIATSKGKKE